MNRARETSNIFGGSTRYTPFTGAARSKTTLQDSASLKPELEFELLKLVLLRERYLKRLDDKLERVMRKLEKENRIIDLRNTRQMEELAAVLASSDKSAAEAEELQKSFQPIPHMTVDGPSSEKLMDMQLVGLLDVIREVSVQVVETVNLWQRSQISYPTIRPYKWNGVNYLEKLFRDLDHLEEYPFIIQWLGFSVRSNPFMVPPELLNGELDVPPNSFLVLGSNMEEDPNPPPPPPKKKYTPSPYKTAIINDPEVRPYVEASIRLRKKQRRVQMARIDRKRRGPDKFSLMSVDEKKVVIRSQQQMKLRLENKQKLVAYESYLNEDMIEAILSCWAVLLRVQAIQQALMESEETIDEVLSAESMPTSPLPVESDNTKLNMDESMEMDNIPQDSGASCDDEVHASLLLQINDPLSTGIKNDTGNEEEIETFVDTDTVSPVRSYTTTEREHIAEYISTERERVASMLTTEKYNNQKFIDEALRSEPVDPRRLMRDIDDNSLMRTKLLKDTVQGTGKDFESIGGVARTGGSSPVLASRSYSSAGNYNLPSLSDASCEIPPLSMCLSKAEKSDSDFHETRSYAHRKRSTTTRIWTQHEIHMQRQVRRRGGELFVLTAVGVEGRMRTPWRSTRFERLERDLSHMYEQNEMLLMAMEDGISNAVKRGTVSTAGAFNDTQLPSNEYGYDFENRVEGGSENEATEKKGSIVYTEGDKESFSDIGDVSAVKVYRLFPEEEESMNNVKERLREVDLRRRFTQYQYDHFKMVASGSLTNIERQRRLQQMQEGQPLEEDQILAMTLEDASAFRIQRRIRLKFGRALRRALIRKRNKCAVVIQNMWRRAKVHMMSLGRGRQLRLALMIQRLYRGSMVAEMMRRLKREAEERVAAQFLQRVFRGFLGRRRLNLKREFVRSLTDARDIVSIEHLTPGHIEDVSDGIDLFIRDYTLKMPTCVLAVLRAILYMFNGDGSECVEITVDGYTEKKYIHASSMNWTGAKLVLQRKGRLLRRLRALVESSCPPNPTRLNFTAECREHLRAIINLQESDFERVDLGKHCLMQLLMYCRKMNRAQELQEMFPEYFDPGQPSWFRLLMQHRKAYDKSDIRRRILSKCKFHLERKRREYTRDGKSWRHVATASKHNDIQLSEVRQLREKLDKVFKSHLADLEQFELKKLDTLFGIERAKALSVEVAKGDLRKYLRAVVIPQEERLRELQYGVDTRVISLLQTRAEIVLHKQAIERNNVSRDFDKIMKVKRLHELCSELGIVLGDLMVLANSWQALLRVIGGFQYVADLEGNRRVYYEYIYNESLKLMEVRRQLIAAIEKELQEQYERVFKVSYDAGLALIHQHWDNPTSVEIDAEAEENRECCRREADFELRQKRQTAHIHIPDATFHPALFLLDSRVPIKLQEYLANSLKDFGFELCLAEQNERTLVLSMQKMIDRQRHIILIANRGSHSLARLEFVGIFNSVVSSLIPTPRVVALDCTNALHVPDWHSKLSLSQSGVIKHDVQCSALCDLIFGKIRKYARVFRRSLMQCSDADDESESDASESTDVARSVSLTESGREQFAKIEEGYGGAAVQKEVHKDDGMLEESMRGEEQEISMSGINESGSAKDVPAHDVQSTVRNGDEELEEADGRESIQTKVLTEPPTGRAAVAAQESTSLQKFYGMALDGTLLDNFAADFHSFLDGISMPPDLKQLRKQRKMSAAQRYVADAPVISNLGNGIYQSPQGKKKWLRQIPHLQYADYVLAATISAIYRHWEPPLNEWKMKDIVSGCKIFRRNCGCLKYSQFCDELELKSLANCDTVWAHRLLNATQLQTAWAHLQSLEFYKHPARYLLTRWAQNVVELVDRYSRNGGRANEMFKHSSVPVSVLHVRWAEDVLSSSNAGKELLGEILQEALQDSMIYQDIRPVKYYYDRGNLESLESQCFGSINTTQKVTVYHVGGEAVVSVKAINGDISSEHTVPQWTFFSHMRVRDLITMLQPNYTEIIEGKVKKYLILNESEDNSSENELSLPPGTTSHRWYELLANWACLDDIDQRLKVTLLRSRFLILSKLGLVDGHVIRQELFEERFGEVRILVYGVQPQGGAVNVLVDRHMVYDLLNYCDDYLEKDKLEALDTQSVAHIFSDRLQVKPSRGWQHWVHSGELLPKVLDRPLKVCIRKRWGPGRCTGRSILLIAGVEIIISLFELQGDTNSQDLRIVIYEGLQCQTAEYRLSAMERIMLFRDDEPLLSQICARLRLVYCDLQDQSRTFIRIPVDISSEDFTEEFAVEGDDEYEIQSIASDADSSDNESDNEVESSSRVTSAMGESLSEVENTNQDQSSTSVKHRRSSGHLTKSRRGSNRRRSSRINDMTKGLGKGFCATNTSGWGWVLYFNRTFEKQLFGNLDVSVALSTPLKGFTFFVYDPRTHRESYRLVSFAEACDLHPDYTLQSLEEEMGNMDESTALDLVDEFLSLVDILDSDDDKLALVLSNENAIVDDSSGSGSETDMKRTHGQHVENIVIARLKYMSLDPELPDTRSKKRRTIPVQRVTINVLAAKELARQGTFGSRSPLCVVKWNYREVGRTRVISQTVAPKWRKESFLVMTAKDQDIRDCSLDLELFDTSADGTHSLTDFLGCAKINGDALVEFLDEERGQWFPLVPARRFHDIDNKYAQGYVQVSGSRSVAIQNPNSFDLAMNNEVVRADSALATSFDSNDPGGTTNAVGVGEEGVGDDAEPGSDTDVIEHRSTLVMDKFGSRSRKLTERRQSRATVQIPAPVIDDKSEAFPPDQQQNSEEAEAHESNDVRGQSRKDRQSVLFAAEDYAILPPSALLEQVIAEESGVSEDAPIFNESDTLASQSVPHGQDGNAIFSQQSISLAASSVDHSKQDFMNSATSLSVMIVAAEHLPPNTQVECLVRFNGQLIQVIRTTTGSQEGIFPPEVIDLLVPDGLPLAACSLELQLQKWDRSELYGTSELRGSALLQLFENGNEVSQKLEADKMATVIAEDAVHGDDGQAESLLHLHVPKLQWIDLHHPLELSLSKKAVDSSTVAAPPNDGLEEDRLEKKRGSVYSKAAGALSVNLHYDLQVGQHRQHLVHGKAFDNPTLFRSGGMPRLQLAASYRHITQESYNIEIISARNLPVADTFGTSDPFVRILMNNRIVGETKVIKQSLNPRWNEFFTIAVPVGMQLHDCELQLNVFDHDNLSASDLLGSLNLQNKSLVEVLRRHMNDRGAEASPSLEFVNEGDASNIATQNKDRKNKGWKKQAAALAEQQALADDARGEIFPLTIVQQVTKGRTVTEKILNCGEIVIRVEPTQETCEMLAAARVAQINSFNAAMKKKVPTIKAAEGIAGNRDADSAEIAVGESGFDTACSMDGSQQEEAGAQRVQELTVEEWESETMIAGSSHFAMERHKKIRDHAFQVLHDTNEEHYALQVRRVDGLVNNDGLRGCHVFALVRFNGVLVGHLYDTKHSTRIQWPHAQPILLRIPRGQTLEHCTMEIELYAFEGSMQRNNICTISLGAAIVKGEELQKWMHPAPSITSAGGGSTLSTRQQAVVVPGAPKTFPLRPSRRPATEDSSQETRFRTHKGGVEGVGKDDEKKVVEESEVVHKGRKKGAGGVGLFARPDMFGGRGGLRSPVDEADTSTTVAPDRKTLRDRKIVIQGEIELELHTSDHFLQQIEGAAEASSSMSAKDSRQTLVPGAGKKVGPKRITLEEPERVVELSTLEINLLSLRELERSLMIEKHPVIDVAVQWNGIEVARYAAHFNHYEMQWVQSDSPCIKVSIPEGIEISDCFLEILLWHDNVCLGSCILFGDRLGKVCGSEQLRDILAKESDEVDEQHRRKNEMEGTEASAAFATNIGSEGINRKASIADRLRRRRSSTSSLIRAGNLCRDSENGSIVATAQKPPALLQALGARSAEKVMNLTNLDRRDIQVGGAAVWKRLHLSPSVPVWLHRHHGERVQGHIQFSALLTVPRRSSTAEMEKAAKKKMNTSYSYIGSDLPAQTTSWTYYFSTPSIAEQDQDKQMAEEVTTGLGDQNAAALDALYAMHSASNGQNMNVLLATDRRKARSFSSKQQLVEEVTATQHEGDADHDEAAAASTNDEEEQRNLLLAQRRKKLQLELAGVAYKVTVHKTVDDHRICWRGRIMPKHFFAGSENARKAIMVARATRLVRTHGIADLQVLAEVHQLKDLGEEVAVVDDLPIAVKEILSEGPGLVERSYRIEISANSGVLMGTATLKDDEEEFKHVVGYQSAPTLLSAERHDWHLADIFAHIVKERLVLDMINIGTGGDEGEQQGKDKRRAGIIQQHAESAEVGAGSMITLLRDKDDGTGITASSRLAAHMPPESEDEAEATVAKDNGKDRGFAAAINSFKRFGRGFGFLSSTKSGNKGDTNSSLPPFSELNEGAIDLDGEIQVVDAKGTFVASSRDEEEAPALINGQQDINETEAEDIAVQPARKVAWSRLHSKTHRVTGFTLRTVVLLLETSDTDSLFSSDPERFFTTFPGAEALRQLNIHFRCKNAFSQATYHLHVTGQQLLKWLPAGFNVDLRSKFRRAKFGSYLLQYLSLRFEESGDIQLFLVEEVAQSASSAINDLVKEDTAAREQKQLLERK